VGVGAAPVVLPYSKKAFLDSWYDAVARPSSR